MNDQRLLELAAKAAGIFLTKEKLKELFPKWKWEKEYEPYHLKNGGMSGIRVEYSYSGELSGTTSFDWNPLSDDGDAFRLAVQLGLLVYVFNDMGFTAIRLPGEKITGKYDIVRQHKSDPCEATRRAIVEAAATIGEQM